MDDYGYEEMTNITHVVTVGESTVIVKPEVSWTDFLVCYWLLVGAIIILNLFIGKSRYTLLVTLHTVSHGTRCKSRYKL